DDACLDHQGGRHRARRAAAARLGHRGADRHADRASGQARGPAPDPGDDRARGRAAHGLRADCAAGRGLYRGSAVTRVLLLLVAFVALTAQRDPILVPEVSQHEIQVRQGFTGTELLLFGAILDSDGRRATRPYDTALRLL